MLTPEGTTQEVECNIGMRQGDPDSPDLFAFYMQQFEYALKTCRGDSLCLQHDNIMALMYANDVLLLFPKNSCFQRIVQANH